MTIRYNAYALSFIKGRTIYIFIKGRFDDAISMHNDVIEIELKVLGEKHPDFLTTKHNLALCFQEQGKCF